MPVWVTPHRPGARPFGWTELGDEFLVQVSAVGGRREMGPGSGGSSVIAGCVSETFADRRSRATATLRDGQEQVETALRPWTRRQMVTRYLPYR
ncbi:hypothetical protein [Actinoplanes couchii]|uniref:hypothetical protein n=1 Tax=Actinoplanes couchii TaxID=403638 RepID=UPI001941CB85|nr:hypothetical protein [Actinoplanes couchii]MDR6319406.1 hypothetical protein [Actinoplanes couchii]